MADALADLSLCQRPLLADSVEKLHFPREKMEFGPL